MTAPRAVTVDLWYTMVYFDRRERLAYESARVRAWAEPLIAAGVPRAKAVSAVLANERWTYAEELRGRSVPLAELAHELERRTGVRTDARAAGQAIRLALSETRLRWMPGVGRAIDRLRRRGLRLGVVSNLIYEPPDAGRDILRRPGAPGPFDAVVISSDGPDTKPSPKILFAAARALRVRPEEMLHVGDSTADLLAAERAGVPFVRFFGHPRVPSHGPEVPRPATRYPSVRSWAEFSREFGPLWRRAGAARERAVRRARTARGRRGRRAGRRGSARPS